MRGPTESSLLAFGVLLAHVEGQNECPPLGRVGCSAGREGEGGEGMGRRQPEIEHEVRQSRRKGTVTDAKGSNTNSTCATVLREARLRTKKSGKKVNALLKKM